MKRPRLRQRDRILWVWLSRLWSGWRASLIIVQPETVVAWHRQGFRLYWRWKSPPRKPGRPQVDAEIRQLIRRMSLENPLWGSPSIRDELALLGINIAKSTVERLASGSAALQPCRLLHLGDRAHTPRLAHADRRLARAWASGHPGVIMASDEVFGKDRD